MSNKLSIGNFVIKRDTCFWIFVLSEINWTDLKVNFDKESYFISSFTCPKVKEGDVILVYLQHSSNKLLHGIVSMCQLGTNLELNTLNIKLFRDINMNKYICKIKVLESFDEPYKISQLEKLMVSQYKSFKSANAFKAKYVKDKSVFCPVDRLIGTAFVKVLINMLDDIDSVGNKSTSSNYIDKSTKSNSESESESEGEESESFFNTDCSDCSSENDEDEWYNDFDNDDIRVVCGHIPILMTPCKQFTWNKYEFLVIKEFKDHFQNCTKCNKTDNNCVSIYKDFESYKFHYDEISDPDKIDELLDDYWNCKEKKFELEGEDRKYNHVHVHMFLTKLHDYDKSILVEW
jgi:hypothetical protein